MMLRNLSAVAIAALLAAAACTGPGGATPGAQTPAGTNGAQPPTATGDGGGESPDTSPAGTAEATPAGPPASPDAVTREVTIGPDEPIHIGFWGVLTGSDAALGIDAQRGVEVALDDRPEVLGHEVTLTSEDGLCTPEGGNTAATRLAADVTLVGLVGSVCSDETVGGIAQITSAGLTTISPSNTRPALTAENRGPEFGGYLRTAHNDEFQGAAAAEFVFNELNLTKAATIHDNSSYAQALQGVFAEEFQELGGEIVIQTAVGGDDTDMGPVLTNVAATQPEIIYYPVFTAPFGFITAQVRAIPGLENVALMGADAGFSAAAIQAGGPNALDLYLSSPDTRQFPEGYAGFLEKYRAKYGGNPEQIFHAHGYDATNILLDAIEAVAVEGADGSLTIHLGDLRQAIYDTADFQGITGTLTCGDSGDCGAPAIGVYQITQEIVDDPQGAWPPAAIWPDLGDEAASPTP